MAVMTAVLSPASTSPKVWRSSHVRQSQPRFALVRTPRRSFLEQFLPQTSTPQFILCNSNYFTSLPGAHSRTKQASMTHLLPPMLLNLFAPRPPLRWVEPADHAPEKRCTPKIGGVGQYLEALREYKDNDGYVPTDSWLQKRDRKKLEKKEKQEHLLTEGVKDCTTSLRALFISLAQLLSAPYANIAQTNPPKIPKSRVTLSKHSSCLAYRMASLLMTSSANSAATVLLSASASSKTLLSPPTRQPRSESAVTLSSCLSAKRI